jgi:hypothetical protein
MKALSALILFSSLAVAQDVQRFSFAAIGDMPYAPVNGDRQVYPSAPYERVIQSINNEGRVRFTVHIGDIKAGTTRCEDEIYQKNLEYFETFRRPLIFTPGDNEWTDCHRENNGIFNPIERLQYLRSVFYSAPKSLGRRKLDIEQQADYPENFIWTWGPVVFVSINQPGSNNNRGRTSGEYPDAADSEYTARNAANMAWLDKAFDLAKDDKIKGVVILAQANPFERFLEVVTPPYPTSGYIDFISKVRTQTQALRKQVLYIGGDTHYYRVDKPLTTTFPAPNVTTPGGTRIMNFTRLEVYGQNDVHWVRVDVDSQNPDLFIFRPVTVAGN